MAETEMVTRLASKVEAFRVLKGFGVAIGCPENRSHLFALRDLDTKGVRVALRYADKRDSGRVEAQQLINGVVGVDISVSKPRKLGWMLE